MAQKALRNTYAYETVGGVEVRRLVVAGDPVPAHYRVDASDFEEEPEAGSLDLDQEDAAPDKDPHEVGLEAGTTDDEGEGAETIQDPSELRGTALEARISDLGGYEELGIKHSASAQEKREAVQRAEEE